MAGTDLSSDGADFDLRDNPPPSFVEEIRGRFPTERESDELLTRKMRRRGGPPYRRITIPELLSKLNEMLSQLIVGGFEVSEPAWFTGGVSKIQMGFTLQWQDSRLQSRRDRLIVRMDPSESFNSTSRLREYELLQAFEGVVPVPRVFWLDRDGTWLPEPALIYSFEHGVTKPKNTLTGKVSGLGTNFGPDLRKTLAPQFLSHLAAIHTFDYAGKPLTSMTAPASRRDFSW